ncbi:heterodisulfide reductase-related iron-sulfur binding cluster, partial [Chloroflexota bacterium]
LDDAGAMKRAELLQQGFGFRVAEAAEYVLIASCVGHFLVPQAMKAFANLLRHFEVDYTLLPKEDCCTTPLLHQALTEQSGEELDLAELLAQNAWEENLRQVRKVGASKIISFCLACHGTCNRFKGAVPEEVMWYPTFLASLFRGGKLVLQADYYSGCAEVYYGRLCPSHPTDVDSPLSILNQIEGLQLNELDHQLCCTRSHELGALAASAKNSTVITTCINCTVQLQQALKERGDYRVVMLPQVVWAAVSEHASLD